MLSSFRKKYPCSFDLITYSIGIFAGFCIWVLFHGSVYALLLAIFGGGAILCMVRGEEIIIWPKSIEQRVKDEEKYLPKYIKRQRGIPFKEE